MPEDTELNIIKGIYTMSFPEEERREWCELMKLLNGSEPFEISVIRHEGRCVGFISYWTFDKFVYIEHFATENSIRNLGIGSRSLSEFKERHKSMPIVLEAEHPEDEMSKRRLGFYERNGFKILSREYIQPPYSRELPSVPLYLLAAQDNGLDADEVAKTLHRYVYGLEV